MNYYELTEWPAFLAAIRAAPDDDLPRLVAADFVEENGDAERAELIRVAVESHRLDADSECRDMDKLLALLDRRDQLARQHCRRWWGEAAELFYLPSPPDNPERFDGGWVKRGFIESVSAPLGVLHGGGCLRCSPRRRMATQIEQSEGEALGYPARGLADDLMALYDPCPNCVDGRTPGVLGELLKREPITAAGIEVTQASPVVVVPNEYMRSGTGPEWNWAWGFSESTPHGEYMIPREVWDLMPPTKLAEPRGRFKVFPTADAARLALGEALYRLHGPKNEVLT